jgi:hypothetical protein
MGEHTLKNYENIIQIAFNVWKLGFGGIVITMILLFIRNIKILKQQNNNKAE